MPINHEKARSLLKEKSFREKTDTCDSEQPTNPISLHKLPTKDEQTPKTVQKSLSNFVVVAEKQPLEQLQKDVNCMLVVLQSLTVGENTALKRHVEVNINVSTVLSTSNLLEVKHPNILVGDVLQILENGCRVTCYTCQQYQMSQQKKRLVNCYKRNNCSAFSASNLVHCTDCFFLLKRELVTNTVIKRGLLLTPTA